MHKTNLLHRQWLPRIHIFMLKILIHRMNLQNIWIIWTKMKPPMLNITNGGQWNPIFHHPFDQELVSYFIDLRQISATPRKTMIKMIFLSKICVSKNNVDNEFLLKLTVAILSFCRPPRRPRFPNSLFPS